MQCAEQAAWDPLSPTKHSPTSPQTITVRDFLREMEVVVELFQQPAPLGQLSFGLSSGGSWPQAQ